MVAANYLIGGLLAGGGQAVQLDGIARRDAFYRELDNLRADKRAQMGEDRQDARQLRSDTQADKRQATSEANADKRTQLEITQRDKEWALKSKGYDHFQDFQVGGETHTFGFKPDGTKVDLGVAPPTRSAASPRLYPIDDGAGGTILVPEDEAVGQHAPKTKDQLAADSEATFKAETAAEDKADEEASQKGGASGPFDDSDFPEDGSREAFKARRKEEIMKGLEPGALLPKKGAEDTGEAAPAGSDGEAAKRAGGGAPAPQAKTKQYKGSDGQTYDAPASLAGKGTLQFNPGKKQFRDADGNVYDLQGNLVSGKAAPPK